MKRGVNMLTIMHADIDTLERERERERERAYNLKIKLQA